MGVGRGSESDVSGSDSRNCRIICSSLSSVVSLAPVPVVCFEVVCVYGPAMTLVGLWGCVSLGEDLVLRLYLRRRPVLCEG